MGDIDYLPPTETVTQLPQLTGEGRERWTASRQVEREKIEQARQGIEMDGKSIHMLTVRELKAAAGVSTDAAANYLRQARDQAIQNQERERTHYPPDTHTHLCPQLVPDAPNMILLADLGTDRPEIMPPAADAGEVTPNASQLTEAPPSLPDFVHGEACEKCACELYRDLAGYQACVRCYPARGYHQYSSMVDLIYPKRKLRERLTFQAG